MEAQRLTTLIKITWCLQSGSRIPSQSPTSSTHVCNHYDKCLFINVGLFFPYHPKTMNLLSSCQGCLALSVMIGFCLYHCTKTPRPPGLGASSPSSVCSWPLAATWLNLIFKLESMWLPLRSFPRFIFLFPEQLLCLSALLPSLSHNGSFYFGILLFFATWKNYYSRSDLALALFQRL